MILTKIKTRLILIIIICTFAVLTQYSSECPHSKISCWMEVSVRTSTILVSDELVLAHPTGFLIPFIMLTQEKFSYKDNQVTFKSDDSGRMVNATEMAKPFGREPKDFLRNKQTINFIEALERSANLPNAQILRVGKGGKEQGTWMHEKLALKFAAWLSPEFELWVFDRIQELLLRGHVALSGTPQTDRLERLERRIEEIAAREEMRALKFAASINAREAAYRDPFNHTYLLELSQEYLNEASLPAARRAG